MRCVCLFQHNYMSRVLWSPFIQAFSSWDWWIVISFVPYVSNIPVFFKDCSKRKEKEKKSHLEVYAQAVGSIGRFDFG